MTRRRKRLLIALVPVLLLAGGVGAFWWYWQATAVDRQVRALLDEVRQEEDPGLIRKWLSKLGLAEDRRAIRRFGEVISDLKALGPSAVPELCRRIEDEDPCVQYAAVSVLRQLRDRRAVEPLIGALKAKHGKVQTHGSWWLDQEGNPHQSPEPITISLEYDAVRASAAFALGNQGNARAVAPLVTVLNHEDKRTRMAAAWALGELGNSSAAAPLIDALKDKDWEVRCGASRALGKVGDVRAVEPLRELLGDEDEDVRQAAKQAIEKLRAQSEGNP